MSFERPGAPGLFGVTVERPVAILMVTIAIVVFGVFSYRLLPVELMPDISYPSLTVRTEYGGAAPEEVEENVTRPVEEALGVVGGLVKMTSVSRAGLSDVTLEFTWDSEMSQSWQEVTERLDTLLLPDEADKPLILRYDPSLDPVLRLALASERDEDASPEGEKRLRTYAEEELKRRLEQVPGVAAVRVLGGLEEEITVALDEEALRRTSLSAQDVVRRLALENVNLAGGDIEEGDTQYLVRTVNEFVGLDEIRDLVIARVEGRDVRVRDVAAVRSGWADRKVITRLDGEKAIELEIQKEADANVVQMTASVRDALEGSPASPGLRATLPAGWRLELVSDRSEFIRASVAEVRQTALLGGLLAVLVLYLFLRDFRTTSVISVAIPASVAAVFAPMNLSGLSLNIMSLGGLALGIGMLVDSGIVVVESIARCREEGDEVDAAVVRGTSEVGTAVIASTLTTVAVFAPMVFVEGVAGQVFADLALTVVFALLAALLVALFLVPALAARVMHRGEGGGEALDLRGRLRAAFRLRSLARARGRFVGGAQGSRVLALFALVLNDLPLLLIELVWLVVAALLVLVGGALLLLARGLGFVAKLLLWPLVKLFDAGFGLLRAAYPPILRGALALRGGVLVLSALLIGLTLWGMSRLDTALIPEVHQGEFDLEITLPVGTPLEETLAEIAPVERFAIEDPRIGAVLVKVGADPGADSQPEEGEHTARISNLVADEEASGNPLASLGRATGRAIVGLAHAGEGGAAALREQEIVDDLRAQLRGLPDLQFNVTRPVLFSFRTPIEVEIEAFDLDLLRRLGEEVRAELEEVPGLTDVESSARAGSPEVQIAYDRDALIRLGLDLRDVADLVRTKIQGAAATEYRKRERRIDIVVRLEEQDRATVNQLRNLVVNPGAERPIPLSAVADVRIGAGPADIRRVGQRRVAIVSANLEGGGLGRASEEIAARLSAMDFPPQTNWRLAGQVQEMERSTRSLWIVLALSVFLVYVVMASQFESFLHPLLIMLTVPLALFGVVVVLAALAIPLSVVVFLGLIMLAGIVVNNAIVLIDYINRLRARGEELHEAIVRAGTVRLRPIMMTTATTVLGLLPMALGLGDGAEIRTPMALTVIAGLLSSTILTLVVLPTAYAALESGLERLRARRRVGQEAASEV